MKRTPSVLLLFTIAMLASVPDSRSTSSSFKQTENALNDRIPQTNNNGYAVREGDSKIFLSIPGKGRTHGDEDKEGCGCAVFAVAENENFLQHAITGLIYLLPFVFIVLQLGQLRYKLEPRNG